METDNLRMIKLSSSETVVGKVTSETNTTLIIFQPLKAVIMPSRSNSGFSLGMMRWEMLFEFEQPVVINKYAIIAIGEATDDIRTAYFEAIKKYNEALSDRRAKSTIDWLIKNGVAKNRLTGKGYGETQLVNKCSDGVPCTEEEHQMNRRSEFIIVGL